MDETKVARVFRKVLRRAGLPAFRVYDLRHTFSSLLLSRNAPITYVAAQLGHANPTTHCGSTRGGSRPGARGGWRPWIEGTI